MTPEQQNNHIEQFHNNGASCLCRKNVYDDKVSKGDPPSLGYPPTERNNPSAELANDKNGSNFWTTKDSMDPIWDTHDSKLAEHELGFKEGDMDGQKFYRFDDNNTQDHNFRIASGYEPGANNQFTGKNSNGEIDPELYHGKISSGLPEAVSDRTPTSELSRSDTPQKFDLPSTESKKLNERASNIEKMPEGVDKQQAVADYNRDCSALNNRIDKEQSYINGRMDACDKEMSEWSKGSTEYNRAAENKQWYENYNNELEQSRPKYISNDFDHKPPDTKVNEPAKADGGVHNQDSKPNATSNERSSKPSQEDNSPSKKEGSQERGQKPSSTEDKSQSKGAERGQKPTEGENKSQGNNSTPRGEKPQEAPQNASGTSQTQRGTPPGSTGGEDSKAPTSSSSNPSDKVSASSNSAKAADEASKVASDQAAQNVAPKPNGMGM